MNRIDLRLNRLHLLEERHPWIFSGALEKPSEPIEHGSVVRVVSNDGQAVATGTYSNKGTIAVRVFSWSDVTIDTNWIVSTIKSAHDKRLLLGYGPDTETTGYRVLFGESDSFPGLVIDRYHNVFVIQCATAGVEKIKPLIIEALTQLFEPNAIVERSDLASRELEGLASSVGVLHGKLPERIEFSEYGLRFLADPIDGQKTGFYLDQKELRRKIRQYAHGRSVLNLFSYTGAHSITALAGGGTRTLNVDSSAFALSCSLELAALNQIGADRVQLEEADVFQFLSRDRNAAYGMVILDPPALIKSRKDIENGAKAYHFLNRSSLRLVEDNGIFVTSSCSQFFDTGMMTDMLRKAAMQSRVELDILDLVIQSSDHPISLNFPEAFYLKSFICRVRRQD